MLNKDKLIIAQLNAMIDERNRQGITKGDLKVNRAALELIIFLYKKDEFRGFKLKCEK